jgi:prepilin-type processing-associated H-X9-DG protein
MTDHNGRPRLSSLMLAGVAALGLSACAGDNEIDVSSGVGITATRSACPAIGVPLHTGDITLFDGVGRTDSAAVDVVATITNLTVQCNDTQDKVYAVASFDVMATRRDAGPARTVALPYFSTVVQGGSSVVAKRIGSVNVSFADGQVRGSGRAQAAAYVDRAAATLPADIQQRITRKRRAGQDDAAVDPLSEPEVRAALQRASFELLVGFQMSLDQLEYNVRR